MPRWNAPAPTPVSQKSSRHPPGVAPDRAAAPLAGLGRLLQPHRHRAEVRKERRRRDQGDDRDGDPDQAAASVDPRARQGDECDQAEQPAPMMPARDIDPNRPPVMRHAAATSHNCVDVQRLRPGGEADAGARVRTVPRDGVADDQGHAHREPAGERVAAHERPVWRRPGVQRREHPVEELRRRRALHRDQHGQPEAEPRHAARHGLDAAARRRSSARTRRGRGRRRRARAPRRSIRHRGTGRAAGSAASRRGSRALSISAA